MNSLLLFGSFLKLPLISAGLQKTVEAALKKGIRGKLQIPINFLKGNKPNDNITFG